jgi:hypothetical protein
VCANLSFVSLLVRDGCLQADYASRGGRVGRRGPCTPISVGSWVRRLAAAGEAFRFVEPRVDLRDDVLARRDPGREESTEESVTVDRLRAAVYAAAVERPRPAPLGALRLREAAVVFVRLAPLEVPLTLCFSLR